MIQKQYKQWLALRKATETCAAAQGAVVVGAMAHIEATIAASGSQALADVLIKLEMAMAGAEGMVESAYADLAPWMVGLAA